MVLFKLTRFTRHAKLGYASFYPQICANVTEKQYVFCVCLESVSFLQDSTLPCQVNAEHRHEKTHTQKKKQKKKLIPIQVTIEVRMK